MNRPLFFVIIISLILGAGCTMSPKYTRTEAPITDSWPKGAAYQAEKQVSGFKAVPELKWREFFTDDKLKKVIEMALNNNRDLKLAALNMQKARALYGVQRAELFPSVSAVGVGDKERLPADLSPTGKRTITEKYSVNLGVVSWEIDFFGRIRSLKDQALEEYLSTKQALRSTRILLVSEVANAYLTLAADREHLKLAESTLEAQKEAYNLIRRRYEVGLVSEIDLRQAQSQVEAAKTNATRYTQVVAQDENALNLLAGLPSPIPDEILPEDLSEVEPPEEIFVGLPSQVLLSRPDILAGEHRLKAANANIGAARAAFFPRIVLTTAAGTASGELSGLFESHSDTWSFAPKIVMPIFDSRLWSAYEVTKVQKEIALSQYEKAIQTAFREVADALALRGTVEDQLSAQQSLVEAFKETYRLSNVRYTKGIDSYLGVLDAQQSLYTAEQGLVAVRLVRLANQVRLYAVLGGGGE